MAKMDRAKEEYKLTERILLCAPIYGIDRCIDPVVAMVFRGRHLVLDALLRTNQLYGCVVWGRWWPNNYALFLHPRQVHSLFLRPQ